MSAEGIPLDMKTALLVKMQLRKVPVSEAISLVYQWTLVDAANLEGGPAWVGIGGEFGRNHGSGELPPARRTLRTGSRRTGLHLPTNNAGQYEESLDDATETRLLNRAPLDARQPSGAGGGHHIADGQCHKENDDQQLERHPHVVRQ
jgi:hypothetical protein